MNGHLPEKQIQHRANTTMHVCWHRNTSVSLRDHDKSVRVCNQILKRIVGLRDHDKSVRVCNQILKRIVGLRDHNKSVRICNLILERIVGLRDHDKSVRVCNKILKRIIDFRDHDKSVKICNKIIGLRDHGNSILSGYVKKLLKKLIVLLGEILNERTE